MNDQIISPTPGTLYRSRVNIGSFWSLNMFLDGYPSMEITSKIIFVGIGLFRDWSGVGIYLACGPQAGQLCCVYVADMVELSE